MPTKKRLFVAMPYGDQRQGALDHLNPSKTSTIDFDRVVWRKIISPAISKARFDAKRADTTGRLGLIDRVYIEWLSEADVVIADLTFGNANVYYELGIRHALSGRGAVLVAQQGANPPFDVRNQTILFYDLWDAGTLADFQRDLRNAIAEAETDPTISPVHLYRPGLFVRYYPDGGNPDLEIEQLNGRIAGLEEEMASLSDDRVERMLERVRSADTRQRVLSLAHQVRDMATVPVRLLEALALKLRGFECFDEAIELLDRAILIDASDPDLYRDRGFLYRLKGKDSFEAARSDFEHALTINDADAELQGMVGGMLKREGKFKEARVRYLRAYELDSTDLYAVVTMGSISAAVGMPAESHDYYVQVITLCREAIARGAVTHWTYLCLGEALVGVGEPDPAAEAYRRALAEAPSSQDLRSSAEALGFLADCGVNPDAAHRIQEDVLWPALRDA